MIEKIFPMTGDSLLRVPTRETLSEYVALLKGGWTPDTRRGRAATIERLGRIADDPDRYLAEICGITRDVGVVILPDGTTTPRLPYRMRWIWDGGFAGQISLRWRPGGPELPPSCLGHIGYAVAPWRQGEGLATRALVEMLKEATSGPGDLGFPWLDVVCSAANAASRRVVEKAGGAFIESFTPPGEPGAEEFLLFRFMRSGKE